MISANVSEINIYPVKGCRGQSLQKANVTPMGIEGDREFAVLLDGQLANQKSVPLLRCLTAQWHGKDSLLLSYPGADDLELDVNSSKEASPIDLYSKAIAVLDMGDEVADWLSSAFSVKLRLVKMKKAIDWFMPLHEFTDVHEKSQNKFVDTSPVLIANQNSLDELNSRINTTVSMDRFRANIVVSGLDCYLEDELPNFVFPGVTLRRVAVCERCVVINVDLQSGLSTKEPLLTLSKYRKRENGYAGGIMFGMYAAPLDNGVICVGDMLGG